MRLPLPASGPKRWAAVVGWALAILVATTFAVSYATRNSLLEKSFNRAGVQIVHNPDNSYTLKVAADRIPTTPQDASAAPPIQILPAHWDVQGQNAPGAADQVNLVPAERAALGQTALGFLSHWETFPALAGRKDYQRWRSALGPYVLPGAEANVYTRVESFSPTAICPHTPCTIGSRWYTGYPADHPMTVRQATPNAAYVTVYGFVRYQDPRGDLNGKLQLREYALVLQSYRGSWRVARAVADSLR
jgi:hypothetical protein